MTGRFHRGEYTLSYRTDGVRVDSSRRRGRGRGVTRTSLNKLRDSA